MPLQYDLISFGNSYAQRQIFSVTVIEAAVRAKQIPLALALVAELKVTMWIGLSPYMKVLTCLNTPGTEGTFHLLRPQYETNLLCPRVPKDV